MDTINQTDAQCTACKVGIIAERITEECIVPSWMRILGPGGKGQWRKKTEYFCQNCGITYKFLPAK